MKPTWYTGALRWVASAMTGLADQLDAAACYAPRLDAKADVLPPDEHVIELRHRLSRYY